MDFLLSIVAFLLLLGAIILIGKYFWQLKITTNTGKYLWLSGAWAIMYWFLMGGFVYIWLLLVFISAGSALYAMYTFSGTTFHRVMLSFTIVLPGLISYAIFSPPWPDSWSSLKPIYVFGPPLVILVVISMWLIAHRFFTSSAEV